MRKATEQDRAALHRALAARRSATSREFIDFVFDRFAGLDEYLADRAGGRGRGLCLCDPGHARPAAGGLPLRGQHPCRSARAGDHATAAGGDPRRGGPRGCDFAVLVPEGAKLFEFYEKLGYETLFYHRMVEKEIRPNLWAQAEFDTLTAPRLAAARENFLERPYVAFEPQAHAAMVQNLYTDGATTVRDRGGVRRLLHRAGHPRFPGTRRDRQSGRDPDSRGCPPAHRL